MPRRLAAALTVSLLVVSACSGDDDDGASGTPASSSTTSAPAEPDGSTTSSPAESTTSTTASGAENPPDPAAGDGEGQGDALLLVADLSGAAEVPGPGDDPASGRVEIEFTEDGDWCFAMEATGLSAAVAAAHVHDGAAGAAGPVVVTIGDPTEVGDNVDRWSDRCVEVDGAVTAAVLEAPERHYVNIHTADFPDGAVRGQLEPATIFDRELDES